MNTSNRHRGKGNNNNSSKGVIVGTVVTTSTAAATSTSKATATAISQRNSNSDNGNNSLHHNAHFHRPRRSRRGRNCNFSRKTSSMVLVSFLWAVWIFYLPPMNNYDSILFEIKDDTDRTDMDHTDTAASSSSSTTIPTRTITSAKNPESKSKSKLEADSKSGRSATALELESESTSSSTTTDTEEFGEDIGTTTRRTDREDEDEDKSAATANAPAINAAMDPSGMDNIFQNHTFFFVHIGKAGGTTVYSNIRNLCIRHLVEHNIQRHKKQTKQKTHQHPDKIIYASTPCWISLRRQQRTTNRATKDTKTNKYANRNTEMTLSRNTSKVIGSVHMNFLTYWWNANDDGEATSHTTTTVQDQISDILMKSNYYNNNGNYNNLTTLLAPLERDDTAFDDETTTGSIPKHNKLPTPASTLPPNARAVGNDNGMTKSTAFLIVARDPIDRLVSAFHYHHLSNGIDKKSCDYISSLREDKTRFNDWVLDSFYCRCFPTIDDLIHLLDSSNTSSSSSSATTTNANTKNATIDNDNNNNNNDESGTSPPRPTLYVPPMPDNKLTADVTEVFHSANNNNTNTGGNNNGYVSCLEIAEKTLRGKSHYKPTYEHDTDSEGNNNNQQQLAEDRALDRELVGVHHMERFYLGHISLNYGFYYRRTISKHPHKAMVVLRTEHLMEDLQDLEYKLGGTVPILGESTGHKSTDYGTKVVYKKKVTHPHQLQVLCCAISSEAKIYMELLETAINLSDQQKKESIETFRSRCNLDLCDRPPI
jgi:hypothetical protein